MNVITEKWSKDMVSHFIKGNIEWSINKILNLTSNSGNAVENK